MGSPTPTNPEHLAAWASILRVLPIPAALVLPDGVVIDANRWLKVEPGETLLEYTEDPSSTLRFGTLGSRWRVRPLDEDGSVLLATGEREDAGDHLLRMFFSSGDSLFVVYDQEGRIIQSNAAWEELLGYSGEEIFGVDSWTLLPEDDLETRANVEQDLRTDGRSNPTFNMRRADGTYRLVQWNLHFDFTVGRCFGIGRDVTEENRATSELQRRATTDALTGLTNRTELTERLSQLLSEGASPALLYCDLDQFKVVNDSLGHGAGDNLLSKLGRRLDAVNVGDDVTVARFGGDEFVVLLDNADEARANHVAETFLRALKRPFTLANRQVHASMSIGMAVCDTTCSTSASDLLSRADTAVYEAKRQGRGRSVLFDEQLRAATARRFDVEVGLRSALLDGQIETWYQPIVELATGHICGAEALVRWRDGDNILTPGHFLDVAEEASLMSEIGSHVMNWALEVAAPLIDQDPHFIMSLNVSHNELIAAGYVHELRETAKSYGVPPENVLIEITEHTAISTDQALPLLNELREHGFKIALDDFGTGYSSLSHLRDLPIDVVKIDRSFVSALNDDLVTRSLTKSLIELSQALNLDVILEGVETLPQSAAAVSLGGTVAQGYLFHHPMPARELLELEELARRDNDTVDTAEDTTEDSTEDTVAEAA